MDRAFAKLVTAMGLSLIDAATVCATTPARALGLQGFGVIAPGAVADLVVLDRGLKVVHTFVAGALVVVEGWTSKPASRRMPPDSSRFPAFPYPAACDSAVFETVYGPERLQPVLPSIRSMKFIHAACAVVLPALLATVGAAWLRSTRSHK